MAIYPSPDKLDEQESKFALVILAAKRARQVKDGARRLVETKSPNPLTIALEEIANGQIIAREVEDAAAAAYREALRPNEPTLEDIIGAGPVLAIEPEPDSTASQLAALRSASSEDDDDMVEDADDEELRPVDAYTLDASGLSIDADEEEEDAPGMDEEDE